MTRRFDLTGRCVRFAMPVSVWLVIALACVVSPSASLLAQEAIAVSGEPFGVGFVRVRWPEAMDVTSPVDVSSPDGRVFYPAADPISITVRDPMQLDPAPHELKIGRGRILERIGQVVKAAVTADEHQQVVGHEIWFLFRGESPFSLKVAGPAEATISIRPVSAAVDDQRIALSSWWQRYREQSELRIDDTQQFPITDAYLLTMLSRRLDLPASRSLSQMRLEKLPPAIGIMSDSRAMQRIVLSDVLTNRSTIEMDVLSTLPDGEAFPAIDPLQDDQGPAGIEQVARMVPPECFYLRFGSFANFLWYQKLVQEYDGNVKNMIATPMLDRQSGQRIEELLNVRYTQLADLFGDKLIQDVAVVGTDLLFDEGPSIGVLLRAKNSFLLSTFMQTDRQATAAKFADCTLETKQIAGIDVSLLSTPDNRVRSYWVTNGDWFFVTSSEHLAERFIVARKSRQTLAATHAFQQFRQRYPVGQSELITLYLSREFLSGLYEPHFQIESLRRSQVAAEIAAIQAARLCAANEGPALQRPEELIAAGFLPAGFGQRADRSGLIVTDDAIIDSRRGARGTMLPIADSTVDQITPSERVWQDQVSRTLKRQPGLTDPIFVQIERLEVPGPEPHRDRLKILADVSPALLGKRAWLIDELGPATDIGVQFPTTDLISFHANIKSDRLNGSIPQHYLFGGIQDCTPEPMSKFQSTVNSMFALASIRGYLAAWPDPGIIDRLPLGLGRGTPISPNMSRLVGGAYRYQSDRVSLLSFHRDVLVQSIPDLAVLDKQQRTRARMIVNDLDGTQFGRWANSTLLESEQHKSLAGADLLNRMSEQLGVDRASAEGAIEVLLGGRVQCALRHQYRLGTNGHWSSSVSDANTPTTSPVMKWFRGLNMSVDVVDRRIQAEIELELQRSEIEPVLRN